MKRSEWRRKAMAFFATYDRPGADAYEKHMARLSRRWVGLIGSRKVTQGLVKHFLDELSVEPAADYGCGWDELRKQVVAWAVEEEWLDPRDPVT